MKDPVVTIACSDVHLSLTPPLARALEPDWLAAMARPWAEIRELAETYGAPVLCAGDLFDKWNSPAELINWALRELPGLYAIPGNHDLPDHSQADIKRSAFWTLAEAGKISVVLPEAPRLIKARHGRLQLCGTALGDATPPKPLSKDGLRILLTHEFMWAGKDTGFHGAPLAARVSAATLRRFRCYDVVVVGDNHQHFQVTPDTKPGLTLPALVNTGTLMRRKSNEAHYRPRVALIHRSGAVTSHALSLADELITELIPEGLEEDHAAVEEFAAELAVLRGAASSLDFADALRQAVRRAKAGKLVRRLLEEAASDK